MSDVPTVALSIMQPWAWLIANGHKDIENRTWRYPPKFRGPFLIHAGKTIDWDCHAYIANGQHPASGEPVGPDFPDPGMPATGGIVGIAELVDVVTESDSEWFVGRYGLVLRNARPIPFIPCRGALGFFKPQLP